MGSATRFNTCTMASASMFNMCLELKKDDSLKKEEQDIKALIEFANGIQTQRGQEINKSNAKEWRDRLMENLPFKAEDILFVNLPSKVNETALRKRGVRPSQIDAALDDKQGNIFIYAGFLKPGCQQIIIYDKQLDKYWAKNIVVDMRNSEIRPGTVNQQYMGIQKIKQDN